MEKHKSSNSVNHSWKLIIQFVGLFGLCCFLVISCSQPQNKPDNAPTIETNTNRITIGTTLKSRTIDPADAYEVISGNLHYNLGDRLYGYKLGTTELVPQLATKMPKISEDGTTYTIPIRQGVTFHDGTPFNAEAMAFSLKRFIKNSGPPSSLLTNTVESIEPTGEYQLTIKLKKPFAAFTPLLAFSGLCAVSQHGGGDASGPSGDLAHFPQRRRGRPVPYVPGILHSRTGYQRQGARPLGRQYGYFGAHRAGRGLSHR